MAMPTTRGRIPHPAEGMRNPEVKHSVCAEVPAADSGRLVLADCAALATPRTSVVALSSIRGLTGSSKFAVYAAWRR
jgi:hypothetical protein